jgi:pyruvate dehydrogenase E2 component (dihydrolipoyllysine-residue acetyltransferase)
MEVVLPKWGVTMQEATLNEWHVAEGDQVEEGQALGHVETDKVDADLESPAKGVVKELRVEAGTLVEVGAVVAIIEEG